MKQNMTHSELLERLKKLGADVQPRTFYNWLRAALIAGPIYSPYDDPNRISSRKDSRQNEWSVESYEDTAAMWVMRLSEVGPEDGRNASNRVLLRERKEAKRVREALKNGESVYSYFEKLRHPESFIRDVSVRPSRLDNFFDIDPLVVSWIAAVEKAHHNARLDKPMKVRFQWCRYCGFELRDCKVRLLPTNDGVQNQVELYVWSEVLADEWSANKPHDVYVGTLSEDGSLLERQSLNKLSFY